MILNVIVDAWNSVDNFMRSIITNDTLRIIVYVVLGFLILVFLSALFSDDSNRYYRRRKSI